MSRPPAAHRRRAMSRRPPSLSDNPNILSRNINPDFAFESIMLSARRSYSAEKAPYPPRGGPRSFPLGPWDEPVGPRDTLRGPAPRAKPDGASPLPWGSLLPAPDEVRLPSVGVDESEGLAGIDGPCTVLPREGWIISPASWKNDVHI